MATPSSAGLAVAHSTRALPKGISVSSWILHCLTALEPLPKCWDSKPVESRKKQEGVASATPSLVWVVSPRALAYCLTFFFFFVEVADGGGVTGAGSLGAGSATTNLTVTGSIREVG